MKTQFFSKKSYSQVFIDSENYDSKQVYAKRRRALSKKLDSFCVFAGMQVDPGCEEAFASTWTRFMQEPAFMYLTGINQAGCYLLLDPEKNSEILFVPPKDPFKEFWIGKRLGYAEGDKDVSLVTGIAQVKPVSELWPTIDALCKRKGAKSFAYAYYFEKFKGDHNDKFRSQMNSFLCKRKMELKSVATLHWDLRLPLEKERIEDAKMAQKYTDQAFRAILPQVKNLKNERQLGLLLDYEMQKRSDGDLAFPTIIAGGENACCLHYVKKDEPLKKGDLVLMDFGIRYNSLHSDITRTIPVSGKFNPLQKMLYEIVLEAGETYQKSVRPGVSLKEISMIPWDYIMNALDARLVKQNQGSFKLLYEKRPHGVSHFIGEQVHEGDPGSRSLDKVLQPGMMISCEPGLYGEFTAIIDKKRYSQKIGIRIEDDLIITEKGCVNISKHLPKKVADIEKIMSE